MHESQNSYIKKAPLTQHLNEYISEEQNLTTTSSHKRQKNNYTNTESQLQYDQATPDPDFARLNQIHDRISSLVSRNSQYNNPINSESSINSNSKMLNLSNVSRSLDKEFEEEEEEGLSLSDNTSESLDSVESIPLSDEDFNGNLNEKEDEEKKEEKVRHRHQSPVSFDSSDDNLNPIIPSPQVTARDSAMVHSLATNIYNDNQLIYREKEDVKLSEEEEENGEESEEEEEEKEENQFQNNERYIDIEEDNLDEDLSRNIIALKTVYVERVEFVQRRLRELFQILKSYSLKYKNFAAKTQFGLILTMMVLVLVIISRKPFLNNEEVLKEERNLTDVKAPSIDSLEYFIENHLNNQFKWLLSEQTDKFTQFSNDFSLQLQSLRSENRIKANQLTNSISENLFAIEKRLLSENKKVNKRDYFEDGEENAFKVNSTQILNSIVQQKFDNLTFEIGNLNELSQIVSGLTYSLESIQRRLMEEKKSDTNCTNLSGNYTNFESTIKNVLMRIENLENTTVVTNKLLHSRTDLSNTIFQNISSNFTLNNEKYEEEFNYAAYSIGARVISSSEQYLPPAPSIQKQIVVRQFDPLFDLDGHKHSKRSNILKESMNPGNCFPIRGSKGYVDIILPRPIIVMRASLAHISSCISSNPGSAPKHFAVYGYVNLQEISKNQSKQNFKSQTFLSRNNLSQFKILGRFKYLLVNSTNRTLQKFILNNTSLKIFERIRLQIESNYGADYTCLYHFQVHGILPNSTCVRNKNSSGVGNVRTTSISQTRAQYFTN